MGTRDVGKEEACRFEAVRQRIGDRTGGEVLNYEVLLATKGAGIGEDLEVLRIEVFVVAVDEGQSMSTQSDQSASVVEHGGRVGLFLGGVDLL